MRFRSASSFEREAKSRTAHVAARPEGGVEPGQAAATLAAQRSARADSERAGDNRPRSSGDRRSGGRSSSAVRGWPEQCSAAIRPAAGAVPAGRRCSRFKPAPIEPQDFAARITIAQGRLRESCERTPIDLGRLAHPHHHADRQVSAGTRIHASPSRPCTRPRCRGRH